MANIAFLLEHEEGHMLPTFPLAQRLAARGHEVSYVGLADAVEIVQRQGFPFSPIMEDVFPRGSSRTLRDLVGTSDAVQGGRQVGYMVDVDIADTYIGSLVRGEDLERAVRTRRLDLFLVSSLFPLHALVLHYRFGLPVVLFTPWLRSFPKADYALFIENALLKLRSAGMEFFRLAQKVDPTARRLADISARFVGLRELILCPRDLELPRQEWGEEHEVYYIEGSIDRSRGSEESFPWDRVLPDRRLLYCSMGSQSHRVGEKLLRFLDAVAEAAAQLPGWQLVLSTGLIAPEELRGLPADAIAAPWVPQIPVLGRASLMITHGGLGTVKECIVLGVPMLVFPWTNDQPENALRIAHHGLGLPGGDYTTVSPDQIAALVREIGEGPSCQSIRENLERMRRRFQEVEESGVGVQRIEEVLERR
jgi:zeaxanthin glucosyltransferase